MVANGQKLLGPKQVRNRTSRRSLRTRRRLMDAALSLFSEKGVDATTIEEITERADVGKGTFYRHFKSKHAAMVALVQEAVDHLLERIGSIGSERKNLSEAIEHLVKALSEFFCERQEEFLLMFQGRLLLKLQRETDEALEEPYVRYLQAIEKQVAPFLSRGIDPVKLRRFACAVAGFVSGFFSFAMIGMESEEMETSLEPLRRAFVATSSMFLGG